jgi:nicotinamidase-related amidase
MDGGGERSRNFGAASTMAHCNHAPRRVIKVETMNEHRLPIESPSTTALLVIDMQVDFLHEQGRLPVDRTRVPALVDSVNAAITEAQDRGALVVHIGNEFPRLSLVNVFRKFAAIAGSPGAALDARVKHTGMPYLAKRRGDAFTNPELHALLGRAGTRRVLLAGVFANACVRSTARGALAHGYEVHVLPDCIASGSERSTTRALQAMRTMGAAIAST